MQTVLLNIIPKQPQQERKNSISVNRYTAAAVIVLLIALIFWITMLYATGVDKPAQAAGLAPKETIAQTGDKQITVNWAEGATGTIESGPAEVQQEAVTFYALTDEQRTLIEQVVAAESGGEPYDGQVAVAQCILNACERDGITPEEVIEAYQYTGTRAEPTASVKEAVAAVFDRGEGVTEEPILYFYAPARCTSKWHESQTFVIEIANHRFFKEA